MKIFITSLILILHQAMFANDVHIHFNITNERGDGLNNTKLIVKNETGGIILDSLFKTSVIKYNSHHLGNFCTLEFSKEDYVSQIVTLNTKLDTISTAIIFIGNIQLFQPCDKGDYEFLKEIPVYEYFVNKNGITDLDSIKMNQVQQKINNAHYALFDEKTLDEYQTLLLKGLKSMEMNDYQSSFNFYTKASKLYNCGEIGFLLEKSKTELDKQLEFENSVKQADLLFNQRKYPLAREEYLYANEIKPNNEHVINQILICDDFILNGDLLYDYENIIYNADKYFKQKEYEKAKKLYERALVLKPEEKRPTKRLKKVNKKLAKLKN